MSVPTCSFEIFIPAMIVAWNIFRSMFQTRVHAHTHRLAGPLCFAGDYVQQQIQFPTLEEGDEVLLLNTGLNAYG